MKDFFYAIQDDDALRALELDNWFAANTVSWLFVIIGFVAMVYWMMQLRIFDNNNEEDKSISAHSYL